MKVIHICQRDDPASGGAARVAIEVVKRMGGVGVESQCLFVYGPPGGLSQKCRNVVTWLGISSGRHALLGMLKLVQFLRRERPDVVHHHDGLIWTHLVTLLFFKGIRVGHAHLDGPQEGATFKRRLTHLIHIKTYDHLVAISESTKDAWAESGFPVKNVEVISNGVDPELFYPSNVQTKQAARLKFGMPSEGNVLLSVGRLHIGMKGTDDFLKVLAQLGEQWYGLIAGQGPDLGALQELAQELGITDRVRFCGVVDPVLPCYQAADVLIVTSHYEPFGLMAVEALASGIPVIGFPCRGGVMDILKKTSSKICDSRDIQEMSYLIQGLTKQDPASHAELVSYGRQFAVSTYSWDSAALALVRLYLRLIK